MRRDSDRTRSAGPLKSRGSGRGSHGFAHHSCKASLLGTRRRSSSDCRAFTGGRSSSVVYRSAQQVDMVAGGDGRRESLSGRLESGAPGLELHQGNAGDAGERGSGRTRPESTPLPERPAVPRRLPFRGNSMQRRGREARLPPGGCVSSGTRCRTRRRREWDCPRRRARGGTSRPWRSRRRGG